jgi:hypothetical protein
MSPDERRRQRISYQPSSGKFPLVKTEFVVRWEPLQKSRFAESDATIRSRMQEPSLGRIHAATGDGRRDGIPRHPPVDIAEAIAAHVAWQLILIGQAVSATAVRRNPRD